MVQQRRPPANSITVAVIPTRIISTLQLLIGIASFAVGCASIVVLTATAHFADQYGLGLFGGVFTCVAGFVGMFTTFRYNNRALCLLNLLCNVFIWFLVLVLLVLFGLAVDYYSRMKGSAFCFRIRDIPISAYYNQDDYELRLYDPLCLSEQNRVAPDGFTFGICHCVFLSLQLFIGAAAIIYCFKALYGSCGGTTPRIQASVAQRYALQAQTQKPAVDYGKGYEMKYSGQGNTSYPPPAYGNGSGAPANTSSKAPLVSAPVPKKTDNAAPSYFL